MVAPLRFGGRRAPPAAEAPDLGGLEELLGWLSWKYVTPDATFPAYEIPDDPDDLRGDIAHWAGKVWLHGHEVPTGDELRHFDLMALEGEFRRYVAANGADVFDVGMTLEEIWGSQQLYAAEPFVLLVADRHADQPLDRITEKRLCRAQSLVWLLAGVCMALGVDEPSVNVLVSDGRYGHTIAISGLNGVRFRHPRGDSVEPGWFSFHDPWPARSLLAPERGYGIRVLEDVSRPPHWLVPPEDLERVIVGFLLPVQLLPGMLPLFAMLDLAEADHGKRGVPLWVEDEERPDVPFALMIDAAGGATATTAQSLLGLGRIALHGGGLDAAMELFGDAYDLDPVLVGPVVAAVLDEEGFYQAAVEWAAQSSSSSPSAKA